MQTRYGDVRILIVEDHAAQRFSLVQLLRRIGISNVHAVEDGIAAAEELQRNKFDLVFCDIEMRNANGAELISAIAQKGAAAFAGPVPMWVWVSALAGDIVDSHISLAEGLFFPGVAAVKKPLTKAKLLPVLDSFEQLKHCSTLERISAPTDEEILSALENVEQFSIHLQPQVELISGKICGAEALCRWIHPLAGMILPTHFIPRMEALNVADVLFFETAKACGEVLARCTELGYDITISINASAQTLCKQGSIDKFDALVARSGTPRSRITVELTEDVAVANVLDLSIAINRLRVLGYGLAIDDFGVGIATLKLLADLPFTELKIDRMFVKDIGKRTQRSKICRSAISLARDLRLRCVAEGVETAAQNDYLVAMGCHIGQGFYWSPAVTTDAFFELLTTDFHRPSDKAGPISSGLIS